MNNSDAVEGRDPVCWFHSSWGRIYRKRRRQAPGAGGRLLLIEKKGKANVVQNAVSMPCAVQPSGESSLAEEFNLTQLPAAWVEVSLLLLPVLKRLQDVVIALDAHICAVAVQVL